MPRNRNNKNKNFFPTHPSLINLHFHNFYSHVWNGNQPRYYPWIDATLQTSRLGRQTTPNKRAYPVPRVERHRIRPIRVHLLPNSKETGYSAP